MPCHLGGRRRWDRRALLRRFACDADSPNSRVNVRIRVVIVCLLQSLTAACLLGSSWLYIGRRVCRQFRQNACKLLFPSGVAHHCPYKNRPSTRPRYPSATSRKSFFLCWLLLFPCNGVQIWQQSTLQGQPVFTTSSVQPAASIDDLRPVRTPNTPLIEPVLRAGPQALRTICVYRPQDSEQPTVLLADDRVFGQLLQRMVCSAFGLVDSAWCLRRLVEALPSLPPEQYVLSPALLPWDQVLVPVDLRPLGGRVRLQWAHRCSSCGEVADRAIQSQHIGPCPVTLCRTSQGWFHPTARLLHLPYGDAFQVWPMHQVPASSLLTPGESDEVPATLEDRFGTSLTLPTTGELAYHDLSGANAVILHPHGHTYTCVPSYADHLTLRSAALGAVASDLQIQPQGQLRFARLLPPLDRMPAVQFVAAYCEASEVLGLVDLRPLDGGVYVVQVPAGATPALRITQAVQRHGEPMPERSVLAELSQGRLQVMHREHVVDPFATLTAAQPAPLVVVRRRSHLAAGYCDAQHQSGGQDLSDEETLDAPAQLLPGDVPSSAALSTHAGVWGLGLGLLLHAPRWSYVLLFPSLALSVMQSPANSQPSSQPDAKPWVIAVDHPSLASVEEHATLGRSFAALDARDMLSLTVDERAGIPEFRFCVWSPGDKLCFYLPGASPPAKLREKLLEAKVHFDRGAWVLWDPLPADRSLHLLVASPDPAIVTVVADTGHEYLCLDAPRKDFGPALLAAAQLLCPGKCFRISESIRTPVRHGDVVRLFDAPREACRTPQFFVPRFTLPPIVESGAQLVYILSVDMGLIRLKIPAGVEQAILERALVVWLGRQRCLGVHLQRLDLDASVPVYCLPRRGRSTLAVGLIDLTDPLMDTVVHVVDSGGSADLDCEVLREPWRPASSFWDDVLARSPVCVACTSSQASGLELSPQIRTTVIGIDICRALSTGWRPPIAGVVPDYDLVASPEHLGIQWSLSPGVSSRNVATQTSAAHWPMRASPLFSSAMPVPRRAAGCSFDERYGADGTLFHLECRQMQVSCTVPWAYLGVACR